MSITTGTKINQLLATVDHSGLLFSGWLKSQGYSEQLQKRYRDSKWLTSLTRGVMYRTGSKLSAFAALASCNVQTGTNLRIAAHSALEFAGFNHYVPMGKPVLTVALADLCKRPAWMIDDKFDMTFRTFNTDTFSSIEVSTKNTDSGKLIISSPELAFLECLLLAPKYYDYVDLYYIMEQLTTLRSDIVQHLLETTNNYRVKRLFLYMAEKAGHYWFEEICLDKLDLGSSKLRLSSNGTYISKYKITIPKSLSDYEG
jgi:hypothetical protein